MKKIWKNLSRILLCAALLANAGAAFATLKPLGDNDIERLMPLSRDIFPLILKRDLHEPYGQETGLIGNPLYLTNASGDLAGAIVQTLEGKSTKGLWSGGLRRFDYNTGGGIFLAPNGGEGDEEITKWDMKNKLKAQFKKIPDGRRLLFWFGRQFSWGNGPSTMNSTVAVTFASGNKYARVVQNPLENYASTNFPKINGDQWLINGDSTNGYMTGLSGVGFTQQKLPANASKNVADYGIIAKYMGLSDTLFWRDCVEPLFDVVTDIAGEARSYDIHPHRLLLGWMRGVDFVKTNDVVTFRHKPVSKDLHDHSYAVMSYKGNSRTPNEASMRELLPDLGQGGLAYMGMPLDVSGSRQYGQSEWYEQIKEFDTPPYLYFQTNDGILHGINVNGQKEYKKKPGYSNLGVPGWGSKEGTTQDNVNSANEAFAFVPPNVYYGKRLASQKFTMGLSGDHLVATEWQSDTQIEPAYLADGRVLIYEVSHGGNQGDYLNYDGQTNNASGVDSGGAGSSSIGWRWRSRLFGMMGRGGAGMYSMTLRSSGGGENLSLKWAVENNLYRFRPGNEVGETVFWSPMVNNYSDTGESMLNQKESLKYPPHVSFDYPYNEKRLPWGQGLYPGIFDGIRTPYVTGPDKHPDYGAEMMEWKDERKYFHNHNMDYNGDRNYWRLGWNAPPPAFGVMRIKEQYQRKGMQRFPSGSNAKNIVPNNPGDVYPNNSMDLSPVKNENAYEIYYDQYDWDDKTQDDLVGNAFEVMVLAAGQQYYTDLSHNGTIGAAIYLVNPFNGKIQHRFTAYNEQAPVAGKQKYRDIVNNVVQNVAGDKAGMGGSSKPVMGMMITPPVTVALDKVFGVVGGRKDLATRFLRSAFTADNQGNIFEVHFVKEGGVDSNGNPKVAYYNAPWEAEARRVATLMTADEESKRGTTNPVNRAIPYRLAVAWDYSATLMHDDLWICGGTANVSTVKIPGVAGGKNSRIENEKQYIFGVNRPPQGESDDDNTYIVRENDDTYAANRGKPLDRNSVAGATFVDGEMKAWYIELENTTETGEEYVSSTPFIYQGQLYVTTYLPKAKDSRMYILNPTTGKSLWKKSTAKYYQLENIHVVGAAPVRVDNTPRIFLSYNGVVGNDDASLKENMGAKKVYEAEGIGIMSIDPQLSSERSFQSGVDYLYYWKQYTE